MRRLTLLPLLILPLLAAAQEERPAWSLPIEEVPVVTRRTMKEIGVQRTQLDSTVLHDNISLSMADVLTQNANLFIKSYGRATLATAEFRGTSPSHTQVTWNGMRINSPMLGTVDFSMIPAFFIDAATLLHGASSIGVTGGALGGAVVLGTRPSAQRGWQTQYVQGVGSFSTFDQYLRVSYGGQRWSASTRAVYSTSDNDFRYTNYDKMELVYGPDGAVVDTYHPVERNRSGYFRDLHLLQELYYNRGDGTRYGLSAWYLRSKRGLPFLSTDYRDDVTILNEQREQTLRAVASWERLRERLKLGAKLGYAYTASAYDFRQRNAQGAQSDLTLSRSYLHTPYGQFDAEYYVGRRWLFTGNVALHVPMVDCSDKSPYHEGDVYDRYRVELSGHLSAKWRPTERIGLAVNLRGELYDRHAVPLIPAFFFDWVVSERGNVVLKASVARNYRYPTLNDRYYQPGGNPDLRPEHGFTYDGGISFALGGEAEGYTLRGEATLFDSHIDDWILWVQARRGYWTPRNVRKVHNYGAETKVDASVRLSPDWRLGLDAHFAWTPSINYGEPVNDACAMLHPLLRYFQRLKADYGVETYAEAQAEGERWMRDVAIRNFDMTGQFEDVTVLGLQPYENLTNCTAAPYAAYLLSKEAPSAEDMADAVDLARFSEDQFTFWDTPLTENGIKDKATPCVYEQYKYQKPVDNSACNVADAMLSLYEATGEEIYLAKGKALIDNITVVQNAVNGQIPTTWDFRPTKSDRNRTYWINCSYSSISSLLRLEKLLAERQK